jgi:hypothetical protein
VCIFLLNPPEPSCQPVRAGEHYTRDGLSGRKCGACRCVPRYWQLIVPPVAFLPEFGGRHTLVRRDPEVFERNQQFPCAWDGPTFPSAGGLGWWSLSYLSANDVLPNDETFGNRYGPGWVVWATWSGGVGESYAIYPLFGGPFRCLHGNTFPLDLDAIIGSFPDTLQLEPYWP